MPRRCDILPIRAELHCHNTFSNFNVGDLDAPYDCGVTIAEQAEQARLRGIGALFVTNHNTMDGYDQLRRHVADHERFEMQILPAEEITTSDGSHIIAYGIHDPIRPGMSLEETIDEIRLQDAVSSAPHPFGLLDAVREDAAHCDMIEVFNSNNVDMLANVKASIFARENDLIGVSGSDSHVSSTLGRCTNLIESEESLDDMLYAMRRGRISIENVGYATAQETIEHLRYKIGNSPEYVQQYMERFYPRSRRLFSVLLRLFERNPESHLWVLMYKFATFAMRRISDKINFQGTDPAPMRGRDVGTMLRMAF